MVMNCVNACVYVNVWMPKLGSSQELYAVLDLIYIIP